MMSPNFLSVVLARLDRARATDPTAAPDTTAIQGSIDDTGARDPTAIQDSTARTGATDPTAARDTTSSQDDWHAMEKDELAQELQKRKRPEWDNPQDKETSSREGSAHQKQPQSRDDQALS